MEANPAGFLPGLKRSLSVWQAIGLSMALMAPSMAANINPQASAGTAGRAVPLTFLIAAVGVLLVSYTFVRLCQYYHHSGSVYAFVGATLGPRAGVVAGWGLLGTYTFYAVVTSTAGGHLRHRLPATSVGAWPHPPSWAPFLLAGVALALALVVAVLPARRGTNVLLTVEGATVALILIVTVVVLVRLLAGNAPGRATHFTLSVFGAARRDRASPSCSWAWCSASCRSRVRAASTLGEETAGPTRDIPRAILGVAVFGGIYFVMVTAIEMMGFGPGKAGSPSSPARRRCSVTWARATSGLGRRRHHAGHHDQRVRLLPGLHRGRGPADVRAGPGQPAASVAWAGRHGGHARNAHGWSSWPWRSPSTSSTWPRSSADRRGQLRLVRHDRHADPAGRVRAGHDRVHHPGVRPAQAAGADVADHRPDRRPWSCSGTRCTAT